MNRHILKVLKLGKKGSFIVVLFRLNDHSHMIGNSFGNPPFVHLEGHNHEVLGIELLHQLVECLFVISGKLYRGTLHTYALEQETQYFQTDEC